MGIQEFIVAIIGIAVLYLSIRKLIRIIKGKETACSCCSKAGCDPTHCNCCAAKPTK